MNATATTTAPTVQLGDFFAEVWGYDQTNVTFYRVVGLTAKSVKLQRWTSVRVGGSGYTDDMVPGPAPVMGARRDDYTWDPEAPAPIKTKRLQAGRDGHPRVSMTSYSDAYLWSGRPLSQTAFGYGH